MAKKNFTISTVATAPSPATSGTSLVVAAGDGALFAVNEPAIVFPVNNQPLVANAEIVMVTNVATDTLTITRTQESTSARTIVEGDIIIQGITAKDWNDLITAVAGKITAFADPNADRIVFWDDSAGAFAALTASTGLTLSGTTLTVRSASETATGIVERATDTEFTGGSDTERYVSPNQVANVAQTMANKTLTSPVINTGVSGTAILDEDNMASDSATQLATQQSIKAYVDAMLLKVYPVGAVYISVVSTSPAVLFGGTWVSFGAGKTLVGLDSGDADFDTSEKTGGAKTVTLTAAQSGLVGHNHTQNPHNHTQNPHSHTVGSSTLSVAAGSAERKPEGTVDSTSSTTATNNATTATNNAVASAAASEAHTNLPPYIVTYMWKRTS